MQKNKFANASEALIWLRGKKYDPSIELTEMQIAIEKQKQVPKSITAAMLRRSSVKALSISFGLFICQQMCGINVVIFYTTDIFEVSQTVEQSMYLDNLRVTQRKVQPLHEITFFFSERQNTVQS